MTRVRSPLTRNPSPLQPSTIYRGISAVEYSLLQPRSALEAAPPRLTPKASQLCLHAPLHGTVFLVPSHSYSSGELSAAGLSAIHFRGWLIRQVSCYTLLSGFRLPWPPSCCLDQRTPFMVSMSPHLGALSSLAEHSASPVPLTERGPLGDIIHYLWLHESKPNAVHV